MEVVSVNNYGSFLARFFANLIDRICMLAILLGLFGLLFVTGHIFSLVFLILLSPFVEIIYHTLFESSKWQATIGKRALGLKVVNHQFQKVSFGVALLRNVCKILSGVIFLLGYIWILIDDKNQGWHDKLADTFVIVS